MEYIRITKIIRTGTSLCVVIPQEILHALKLQRGDQVVVRALTDRDIAISKISSDEIRKINLPNI